MWDDDINVKQNPYLNPATVSNTLHFWTTPYAGLYIPLTYSFWATVARFAGFSGGSGRGQQLDPRLFHEANLILHLASALVVFVILRILVRKDWPACAGALLFALHPAQVEAVAWVSGLKDLLSGFFSLVALWQYLAYAGTLSSSREDRAAERDALHMNRGSLHYLLATLAFALALLSKPSAVVVPGLAWVLDHWILGRPARQCTLTSIGWVGVAIPFVMLTKSVQPDAGIEFVSPVWGRFFVAGDALGFYLYKLAVPIWLGPDYGRSPDFVLQHGWVYITGILPYGLAVWLYLWRNRFPWLVASAGLFVVGVLPTLGLIPFDFQSISTVADRYLYLSMLAPALLFAYALSLFAGRCFSVKLVGALFLVSLGFGSCLQASYWQSPIALFGHALRVNPRSWMAHNNLAIALADRGKLDDAVAHYRSALLLKPGYAEWYYNLGNALVKQGKVEEAVTYYFLALRIRPDYANAHFNLANILASQGKFEEAAAHYFQTLKIQPDYPDGNSNLGNVLAEQGKLQEAIVHYSLALRSDPSNDKARLGLSRALKRQSRSKFQQ